MYKSILLAVITVFIATGCFSTGNVFKFGELDNDVANQDQIINNHNGSILALETTSDTEVMTVILPKDDLTLRIRITAPNIEDVLYMNIVSNDDFKINKIIRRVSDISELDLEQDGWVFEPSIEKNVIILQLYLPSIYLYTTQFRPTLNFSYKRSSRSLQDSIKFNFIRQNYYATHDDNGHEIAKYGTLEKYCEDTSNGVSENFLNQIDLVNKKRVGDELENKLRGVCQ
jgi:hypothetical protein